VDGLKVEVGGLAQLSKGLRGIDADGPKELRLALNSAAQLLVDTAKPKVPSVTGAARRSMVARSTRTSARVSVGGRRAPYYPWLDFGGTVGRGRKAAVAVGRGRRRTASQQASAGSVRRQFIREGRYIYPTLRQIRPRIEAQLQESITAVIRNAGLVED
jgi:hypothetical protein